jgi:hypothetical protein
VTALGERTHLLGRAPGDARLRLGVTHDHEHADILAVQTGGRRRFVAPAEEAW